MKKIIFVCTGNTCRSPMAEMVMKNLLAQANINDIDISSRGLSVLGQSPVSPHVATILDHESIHLTHHESTFLREDDITDETLILTMTDAHKQVIHSSFPSYSRQTYTLAEYVTGSHFDIQDPYGGDMDIYKKCFFQLEELLTVLVKSLPTP